MFKNYLITALNNLIKNKLYSTINIVGLAIGLSACIVISLYVKDQYSYDKHWENSDRIYRVNCDLDIPGREPVKFRWSPVPAMPLLEEYFNDKIEKSTRAFPSTMVIDTGDAKFEDTLVQVDPAFIEMFHLEVLSGSLENTLLQPNNIALSEKVAKRHFGEQDPIGKVLTLSLENYRSDYKVTAVYRIQGNTVINLPLLSLFDDINTPGIYKSWLAFSTQSFFLLKEGVDINTLTTLMPPLIDKHVDLTPINNNPDLPSSDYMSLDFQKLEEAYIDSPWDDTSAGGNKTIVMSFAAISILVLIIGCVNFTILTTAKATQRAREVAMRKVVGAKRKQLITQFLGESTFITLLAMLLSLGIVEIMLPVFEIIIGKNLSLDYTAPSVFLPLLVMLIFVGISGGLYPAFVLSGFKPGDTLKANQSKETSGSMSLRGVLVIFQFTVSIVLIIATGIIYTQMKYSLNRDPGYNKENLLIINQIGTSDVSKNKINPLKQELQKLSNITDVGMSQLRPGRFPNTNIMFSRLGQSDDSQLISITGIGYNFFKTYQIPFIAGRNYSEGRDIPEPYVDVKDITIGGHESKKSEERSIIINESAARRLGFTSAEEAVGEVINTTTVSNTNYTIIGVITDNYMSSINAPPVALVYLLSPDQPNFMTLRFKGSPHLIAKQVKSVWENVMGDKELSTVFADQLLEREFKQEQTEIKVFISFSLLAIVIACMGLFGSASFTVEKRTKEIGLRKVMGAKVKNIVSLLLWQFSKPVLIANIIAWPVAIFAMHYWLERFTYQFNSLLMIPICLTSGLIALIIAWLTVSGNTTRVAKSKPIKALRYE